MNETKFYRYNMSFYKVVNGGFEHITAYHHCIGIEIECAYEPDVEDLTEITEAQYNRARKVVMLKLLNQ